jgi:hypothetical protein
MSWDYTKPQIKNLTSNPEKSKATTFKERCLLGKEFLKKEPWDLKMEVYKNRNLARIGYFQCRRGSDGVWVARSHGQSNIKARTINEMYYLIVKHMDEVRPINNRPEPRLYSFLRKETRKPFLEDENMAVMAAVSLGMGEQKFLPSNRYGYRVGKETV